MRNQVYEILFEAKAKKQFYKLDRQMQKRIANAIDNKLAVKPDLHLVALTGDLVGLYKFRVGNYRLLCAKEDEKLCILVVKVKHRNEIYRR